MATHRVPVLGGAIPDTSGKAWMEPYQILATNDVWGHMVGRIDGSANGTNDTAPTTRIGFYGRVVVPKNYVGTAKVIVVWTSTVITGDVVWDFDYRAVGGNDTESLDQAGTQESVSVTDTAPSAAHERMECEAALTSANLAVDDELEFYLVNDGTDAADTLAGARLLVSAFLQFADA